jgi:uncharacterized membrane protein
MVYRCSVALWIVGGTLSVMAVILFPKVQFEDLNRSAQITIIVALSMLVASLVTGIIDMVKKSKNRRKTHGI